MPYSTRTGRHRCDGVVAMTHDDLPTPITAEHSYMIGSPKAEIFGPEHVVICAWRAEKLERDLAQAVKALENIADEVTSKYVKEQDARAILAKVRSKPRKN